MKKTLKNLLYVLMAIVAFSIIRAAIITIFWEENRYGNKRIIRNKN